MVGHGCPKASWGRHLPIAPCAIAAVVSLSALGIGPICLLTDALADEVCVRIAWGGGADRTWQGTVTASEGSLAEPHPLGIEADETGSMWLDEDAGGTSKLLVRQRSPRNYDGVDVLVHASSSAALKIQLVPADEPEQAVNIDVPLTDLSGGVFNKELDRRGNRLLVMRAPGDMLRIRPSRDSLVFAPGEVFQGTLEPHALPLADGAKAKIHIQLNGSGGKELWSQQHDVQAGQETAIPLEIPLPDEEGVYDVSIVVANGANWSQAVRQPLHWKRTIAERRVQLLVLGAQPSATSRAERESVQVVEIDPANPRWFEKLNKLPQIQLTRTRMPRLWKGPLGNGCTRTKRHPLGDLVQLAPNAESPDVSWEAYWLPVNQPGRPHILEVEYPSDVSQTLGISVIEPNAAGTLAPLAMDSGFDHTAESVGGKSAPRWLRHRLVFWPRTATPLLLMTNGRDRAPAMYGKIRVLSCGERLPPATAGRPAANHRLLAAYFDRPLIPESFSAEECVDPWSGKTLDDWGTFYEGSSRLVEYLDHAGYNALMLGVLADGSTLYPSKVVSPTPRYDTGAFSSSGQDPVRKDVLEMLFRLFDRADLELIPMVEFAAPLPELEAIRRAGGPDSQGIEWIGSDGGSWSASSPAQRGLAPYYNPLHPRVQQAMLGVLHELAERYAVHPSFAGLAVRLSADGYAQLLGPDWGLDDATIAEFARDAHLNVPGGGPQRFAARAAFLAQEPQRKAWLEWRALKLGKFYRRVQDDLATIRPGSRLYLAGAGMTGGPELEAELRPSLPRRATLSAALMRVGVDTRIYQGDSQRIVLLRPERILPQGDLNSRATDLEIGQLPDVNRCFQTPAAGSLFFHQPREVRVASFDPKNPFKPSDLWLVSQSVPSAAQNRRRFVHSLATLDAQAMFDGGWLLPMGQEESTRDVLAAFRSLPSVSFQPVGGRRENDPLQPVTFRSASHGGQTYLYAVNDAPFSVTARIHVEAAPACCIEELTGTRKIAALQSDTPSGMVWEVRLDPYDLVAAKLSEANVQLSNPQAAWASEVEASIASQIRNLGARAASLRKPPALDIIGNPGFERAGSGDNPIADWAIASPSGASVQLDTSQKHGGQQAAKITSTGVVACLVSQPFAPPATGRLSMAVWLRTPDAGRQPPLRLALEGGLHGRDYYRYAAVGSAGNADPSPSPISSEWTQYVFPVDDLPLEGLTSLRVRFDLMGAGEVWVDDVQVFGLAFNKSEMLELSKLITLADVKLQNGQIGDCLRLLDGYWPRFLEENVPLSATAVQAEANKAPPHPAEEPPPERTGFLNRVKDMWPESLRF